MVDCHGHSRRGGGTLLETARNSQQSWHKNALSFTQKNYQRVNLTAFDLNSRTTSIFPLCQHTPSPTPPALELFLDFSIFWHDKICHVHVVISRTPCPGSRQDRHAGASDGVRLYLVAAGHEDAQGVANCGASCFGAMVPPAASGQISPSASSCTPSMGTSSITFPTWMSQWAYVYFWNIHVFAHGPTPGCTSNPDVHMKTSLLINVLTDPFACTRVYISTRM